VSDTDLTISINLTVRNLSDIICALSFLTEDGSPNSSRQDTMKSLLKILCDEHHALWKKEQEFKDRERKLFIHNVMMNQI